MLKLKKINLQSIYAIDLLFLSLLVNSTLLMYFNAILSRLPFIGLLSEFVEPVTVVFITLIALSLPRFLKVLTINDYLFYIVCVCVFFLHYFLYEDNQIYLDDLCIKFNLCVLPCYFIGRTIDYERNSNLITLLSILSILSFSYLHFFIFSSVDKEEDRMAGDMGAAFTVLPFIILTLLDAFKTKRIISICLSVYGVFLLLSLGNRGSLLYTLVYLAILSYHKVKHMTLKRKMIILLIIGFVGLCFMIFYDVIFMFTYVLIEQSGMSLRILDKVVEEELGDSSGRDEFVNIILKSISENPLGLGVGGDRFILKGIYVHNLFIELLSIFGYFGGICIIFFLLRLIYKAYKTVTNTNVYSFYVAMVCFGCLPLLTSSSLLEWPFFFLLLGYSVKVSRMKFSYKETACNYV